MRYTSLLKFACVMIMILASATAAFAQEHDEVHWGYEGDEGADHWGELAEEWAACSEGSAQSPIDITSADATEVDLTNIEVHYGDTGLNIFNNGHTIQVNYDEGSSIVYNEIEYQLLQFHFHYPSEHTLNGQPAAMEIHFVHASDSGNLAVIGVMLRADEAANSNYAMIFDYLPAEAGEPQAMEGISINATTLLPESATFYTYNGSLTTPPCSQIVRWLVMTEPVMLSSDQIAAFGAIYNHNARPVQPLNDRDLFVDMVG